MTYDSVILPFQLQLGYSRPTFSMFLLVTAQHTIDYGTTGSESSILLKLSHNTEEEEDDELEKWRNGASADLSPRADQSYTPLVAQVKLLTPPTTDVISGPKVAQRITTLGVSDCWGRIGYGRIVLV